MKQVDILSLTRFVAIAEHHSFRAASRALFVAQPTLSKQMQELEEALGVTLFDRGRWGVRLTPSGEALLVRARLIIEEIESLPSSIRSPQEIVRVGAASTAAGSFLAPFLGHWIPAHPEVHITLIEDGLAGLGDRLRARECDVALVASPVPPVFQARPIKTVSVQAVLPHGHPLAVREHAIEVADLAGLPVLVNGDTFLSTELVRAACALEGVELREIYHSPVGQTLAALVENGLGIAVMADSVDLRGFDLPRRVLLDRSGQPLQFTINVAYEHRLHMPPGLAAFVEDLTESFEDISTV